MKKYIFLSLAILFEILGTTGLKYSEQFTKLLPSLATIVCYCLTFYFLSITLKELPVGIAYAIWSGVGIVALTFIGIFAFKQIPDLPAIIGISLIVAGVVIINLFSKTSSH